MFFKKSLLATCVSVAVLGMTACSDSDNSTGTTNSNATLSTSTITLTNDNIYVLAGGLPGTIIGNGDDADGDSTNNDSMNLVVEEGTLILGGAQEALVVTRGSVINANGTAANPIVMTSESQFDAWAAGGDGTAGRGEWAGFALMGNAETNECATPCDVNAEGGIGAYGGTDNADSSGNISYVVVRHAGYDLDGQGNELNGFTLFGVGSGTSIDHIQVHKGLDDGIEHFGSSDFMSHVVLTDNADDSFDWGQGYTGGAQFMLIQQADDLGDRGIEADNDKTSPNGGPISLPQLANMTIIAAANPAGTGADGMLFRRGTGAKVYNSIVTGFADACIDIDEVATMERAFDTASSIYTGDLMIQNSFVDCTVNFESDDQDLDSNAATGGADNDEKETFTEFNALLPNVSDWFAGSGTGNDSTTTADLSATGVAQNAFATATTGLTANGLSGDYVDTTYAGAFDPAAATQWTDGWTVNVHGNTTVWTPAVTPATDNTCPEGTTWVGTKALPASIGGGTMDLCQLQRRYDASDVI